MFQKLSCAINMAFPSAYPLLSRKSKKAWSISSKYNTPMTLRTWWGDPINKNYVYAYFKNFAFFSAVLVPFFTDWGHITLFQVQILQSWFSVWVFLFEVPTGAIADKIGR